jgi:hypothetical protein
MRSVAPDGLKKGPDGRAVASSCMFHDACSALSHPALSEVRGSGLGGVADPLAAGAGAEPAAGAECDAHPASGTDAIAHSTVSNAYL